MAAAVGSLMMRFTAMPEMVPASCATRFVAMRVIFLVDFKAFEYKIL